MLAATLGGLLATWVTFTPASSGSSSARPIIETLRGNKGLAGALSAITAAVVGVILNLSIWFALHTLFRQTTPVRSFGLSFDMPVWSSLDLAAFAAGGAAATAIFRFNIGMLTGAGGVVRRGRGVAAGGGHLSTAADAATEQRRDALVMRDQLHDGAHAMRLQTTEIPATTTALSQRSSLDAIVVHSVQSPGYQTRPRGVRGAGRSDGSRPILD